MSNSLTDQQQKQFAIAVLLGTLLLIFSVTVVPLWFANASRQENIHELQERLVRLQRMMDENVSLRPQLQQLRRAELNNGHYLRGDTETVAAAELQRLVKTVTGRNQISVTSTQILPAIAESNFVRVALKVRVRGPLNGLIESIYDIESDQTFLFLDKLIIRDAMRRRSSMVTAAKPFEAEFDLSAYAYMPDDQ